MMEGRGVGHAGGREGASFEPAGSGNTLPNGDIGSMT